MSWVYSLRSKVYSFEFDVMKNKLRSKKLGQPDYLIIVCLVLLTVFGLIALASASSNLGKIKFGDSYYYLKHQIYYGLSMGVIGFLVASKLYYRRYEKFALLFLVISIFLLALVFTPLGVSANGAARWLNLYGVTFQPSEILKLAFIIYIAAWLGGNQDRHRSLLKGFLPFFIIIGVVVSLLFKQPATSIAVILIFTALTIYFISGAKMKYVLWIIFASAITLAILIYLTPYRMERITSFFNKNSDIQDSGFQLNQAQNAIGSGGLTGVGYGQSTTKLRSLPEPQGDSIFAVIAEEMGFIGSTTLVTIFFVLVLRIFILAKKCPDKFGQLLLIGFGALLTFQAFTNIAAISGLIPLTGTPLPFISYGGTALAVFMTMGGIITNISKYV